VSRTKMDDLQNEFGRETKRRRGSPLGEDCYLLTDGRIKRDEDAIIAVQQRWKEAAYKPVTGIMYKKALIDFELSRLVPGAEKPPTYFPVYSNDSH